MTEEESESKIEALTAQCNRLIEQNRVYSEMLSKHGRLDGASALIENKELREQVQMLSSFRGATDILARVFVEALHEIRQLRTELARLQAIVK